MPQPVEVEGELEYEVARILDSKIERRRLKYLVDWCDVNSLDKAMWAGAANSKGSNSSQFMHRILPKCKSMCVTAKY